VSNPDEIRGAATAVELITDTDVVVVETERNGVAIRHRCGKTQTCLLSKEEAVAELMSARWNALILATLARYSCHADVVLKCAEERVRQRRDC